MTSTKTIITAVLSLLVCLTARSQSLPALLVPTDARSLAMGGVSLPKEADLLDAHAYFGKWAPKTADNTIVGADAWFKIGSRLALSAEGKGFLDKPYSITGAEGSSKGSYKPYDLIIGLGAEFLITDAISAGLKVRNVTSALAEKNIGSSIGGDIFVRYNSRVWGVELAGRNIGSPINYGEGAHSIPSLAAVSGYVRPVKGLSLAAEADYLFKGGLMASAGAEYGFKDMAFVRAGFHYGDPAKALPTFLSLGLGGKLAGFKLDGTFLLLSETLGNSFLVSLGYEF